MSLQFIQANPILYLQARKDKIQEIFSQINLMPIYKATAYIRQPRR